MQTFLADVVEAPTREPVVAPPPTRPPDPLLLAALSLTRHPAAIAGRYGVDRATVTAWLANPIVEARITDLESAVRRRIMEFADDPVLVAKAEAPVAMRRICARGAGPDAKVAHMSDSKVLEMAGVVPPKRVAVLSAEVLMDQMTATELAAYAETGDWPLRFGDQVRRLEVRRRLIERRNVPIVQPTTRYIEEEEG